MRICYLLKETCLIWFDRYLEYQNCRSHVTERLSKDYPKVMNIIVPVSFDIPARWYRIYRY